MSFENIKMNDSLLQYSEKIILALRSIFNKEGYKLYRMGKFEEYDLYARNKDFLVSDNVITFTDSGGKLMALKPDVTLSIVKNSRDIPGDLQKVYYNENVYRVDPVSGEFKELMQTGAECFGPVTKREIIANIRMASESLKMLSNSSLLSLSDLRVLSSLCNDITEDEATCSKMMVAISEKNISAIEALSVTAPMRKPFADEKTRLLIRLLGLSGPLYLVYDELNSCIGDLECSAFLLSVLEELKDDKNICFDFSVTDDINYYNGIVFKGHVKSIPNPVLSGGQYDRLMERMGRHAKAIGFAVYTDEMESCMGGIEECDGEYLNIALPKGRLGNDAYAIFKNAGFECDEVLEPVRKLIFDNPHKKLRYFWVKPSDVPIYVQRGAADVGVAGKDILWEYSPEVYEFKDLGIGKCCLAVAGPAGKEVKKEGTLKVATKFTEITKKYYRSQGRNIDIIKLNGSIELAPILGLSDVIVDIVQSGTTLKENNLEVKEVIKDVSARLIVNKSSYRFKQRAIDELLENIKL